MAYMDRALHSVVAMIRASFAVVVIAFETSGCVDPESRFDEFAQHLDASLAARGGTGPVGDAGACAVAPGDVAGLQLLSLSVSISAGTPILALLDVTTPAQSGGAAIQWSGSPLSAADRQTPVGSTITAGPFPIDASGGFRAELPGLQVSGEANPITGADIVADVVLIGSLCLQSGGFYCGTVEGRVTAPIDVDLTGSTFTLSPVLDPQTLPPTPPINCAGTPADPL
jgi:hypothetical protein